jgi:hypothetical protein
MEAALLLLLCVPAVSSSDVDQFVEFQSIPTKAAREWEFFDVSGEPYLVVANYKDGGNCDTDSKIYKWDGVSFVEFQSIPTHCARSWEAFKIAGEHYIAVANMKEQGSSNSLAASKIYKWDGASFVEFQIINTDGAQWFEAFEIAGEPYLAAANEGSYPDAILPSKVYKWDGANFVEFQSLPDMKASHLDFFEIAGEPYLAASGRLGTDGDSQVYKWNGASFAEFQSIPSDGAVCAETFEVDGDMYLAVANFWNGATRNCDSHIYKWNGVSFEEFQTFATKGAQGWEFFTIGPDRYLALANEYDQSQGRNIDSKIYKWDGVSFAEFQDIRTNGAHGWEAFEIAGEPYLAVVNMHGGNTNSKIYKWDGEIGTTVPPPTECSLPDSIDPNNKCVLDANYFSTLDADSDDDIPISLAIAKKGETTDAFNIVHGATVGDLTDDTDTDSRYILACPQAAGVKTIKVSVSRPSDLTAFGGEWVKLFPKDSWENKTNEYEPFTFNDFGAKIPLPEFRPTTTGLTDDAAVADVVHVFMEVQDEGDYELRYGNPYLVSDGRWVAVEFKETLLRVGTPWAECTDDALGEASYEVGSIMPILFGGPNLNSIALKAGNANYYDVIAELTGVSVPVKVVLEIFNAEQTSYTSSAADGQCYKAGNACPEAHLVCKPEYCEMDVWASLIASFKAASAGKVTVLGSVDSSTTTSQYAGLDMDGFYFTDAVEAGYTGTSVLALGSPLFDETAVDSATVYVTLASKDLGLWNPFSWYPYVSPSKWAAIVTEATDASAVATLVDRGYGYVYLTSQDGFETASTIMESLLTTIEATSSRRQLQGRRLETSGAATTRWGCDDTLFECTPICLKTTGLVTTKVSETLCAGAPQNPCACRCYHEAQWTCEGSSVVCKAKFGAGELQTVGDKVCETRGAPKPSSSAELRVASVCEPLKEMRGSAPTAQCLAEWGSPQPSDVPATPASATEMPPVEQGRLPILDDSCATTLAIAALALNA